MRDWADSKPASLDVTTYQKNILKNTDYFMNSLFVSRFARGLPITGDLPPMAGDLQVPSTQKIFGDIIIQGFSEDVTSEAAIKCYRNGFLIRS